MENSKVTPVQVAIVGLGTVGSGVARLLGDFGQRTARHAGRPLVLKHVVVRDAARPRQIKLPASLISTDLARITSDPDVSIVALLVGGLEPARTYMLKLLESGKDVVTANKALLAEHGPELFARARKLGRSIAFEASVGGGIPIIANISTCLSANQIESIHAILNGTSNYILTQMEARGAAYADAVAEGAAAWLCRSRSVDGRRRQRCGARSWRFWPIWRLGAGRLARDSPPWHRHARSGRSAVGQRAWLSHQAVGRGSGHRRPVGSPRFAGPGQTGHTAGRSPRGL